MSAARRMGNPAAAPGPRLRRSAVRRHQTSSTAAGATRKPKLNSSWVDQSAIAQVMVGQTSASVTNASPSGLRWTLKRRLRWGRGPVSGIAPVVPSSGLYTPSPLHQRIAGEAQRPSPKQYEAVQLRSSARLIVVLWVAVLVGTVLVGAVLVGLGIGLWQYAGGPGTLDENRTAGARSRADRARGKESQAEQRQPSASHERG